MTELHYVQAADLFKQAVDLVPPGHPNQIVDYLTRQGNALYRQGDERGDNAALERAITIHKTVLQEWTRERVPLDWAMTQNNLGNALEVLGQLENGTAELKEAIAAWDACLTVVSTAWPPEWVEEVRSHRKDAQAEIAQRLANNKSP